MENVLIILAVIGSVIYKIYTGYKEEMDKAAKRTQPRPPAPRPIPTQQTSTSVPKPLPPPVPSPSPQEFAWPEVPTEIVYPKQVNSPSVYDYNEIPEETRKIRNTRAQKKAIQKKLELIEDEEYQNISKEAFEFDLRKAVINAAILDRPYQ